MAAALLLACLPAPSPAATAAGVYQARCAVCHGVEGRGDGLAAALLSPRPSDFTAGTYKFRVTPTGTLPQLWELVNTINDGLRGTSMPPFRDVILPYADQPVRGH